MRSSFRRVGYVVVAVLLGLAGAVTAASPASAEVQLNVMKLETALKPCSSPCGVQDARTIPANTLIHTYCAHEGYNVVYSGPATGRGGYVFRLRLAAPEQQTEACPASGAFSQVSVNTANLRSCSGTCVDFGEVTFGDILDVFCQLGSGSDRWFLVFVNNIDEHAGFLHQSAMTVQPNVPNCNDGF